MDRGVPDLGGELEHPERCNKDSALQRETGKPGGSLTFKGIFLSFETNVLQMYGYRVNGPELVCVNQLISKLNPFASTNTKL